MKKQLNLICILLSVIYGPPIYGQADYRANLQAKLDSIVNTHEATTGTDFGPGMAFSFKEPYLGVMQSEGTFYTAKINSISYNTGDSISLFRAGILGGTFVYGKFDHHDEFAIISGRKINDLVVLQDSIGFWNQFEKIKKVKAKDFAQYWLILDCNDEEDGGNEKNERAFMNFGTTSLSVRLKRIEDQFLLEFDFYSSVGNDLRGLGCADSEDAFVEFKFEDGSVVKKHNLDLEFCQTLKIDISEDIAEFEKPITELKFSMSKKEKNLLIDHEIPQNQINLKLDCLID
jgi:hypothetical protein